MRKLKIELRDILELITCAEDYGFKDDVLFDSFADMLGRELTDEEIECYARELESLEGYGEEDYEDVKERLEEFKEQYCN